MGENIDANYSKNYFKAWGGHHLPPAALIFVVLYFLPPVISVPLAHAMIWFAKELGEATQRAGGTGKALKGWRDIKRGPTEFGIWEHWDWITPAAAGFITAGLALWLIKS